MGEDALHRISQAFLTLEEWRAFDYRAWKRKRNTRVSRNMAMLWWFVSTKCEPGDLKKIPPWVADHPDLKLLPRAWEWVFQWQTVRRKRGFHYVQEAPLFCTTNWGKHFPGPIGTMNDIPAGTAKTLRAGCLGWQAMRGVRTYYTAHPRIRKADATHLRPAQAARSRRTDG